MEDQLGARIIQFYSRSKNIIFMLLSSWVMASFNTIIAYIYIVHNIIFGPHPHMPSCTNASAEISAILAGISRENQAL